MNVLDLIVYVFNSITGASFQLMSLSELSAQASAFTYWTQIFDVPFIISFVISQQKSPWIAPRGLIVLYGYELFHILNCSL